MSEFDACIYGPLKHPWERRDNMHLYRYNSTAPSGVFRRGTEPFTKVHANCDSIFRPE